MAETVACSSPGCISPSTPSTLLSSSSSSRLRFERRSIDFSGAAAASALLAGAPLASAPSPSAQSSKMQRRNPSATCHKQRHAVHWSRLLHCACFALPQLRRTVRFGRIPDLDRSAVPEASCPGRKHVAPEGGATDAAPFSGAESPAPAAMPAGGASKFTCSRHGRHQLFLGIARSRTHEAGGDSDPSTLK